MVPRSSTATARRYERLAVRIYPTRQTMGADAAADIASEMRRRLAVQPTVRMVFAAAPSQNEMLAALCQAPGLDWARVEAFHMDEYLGLPASAPQRFARYLYEHLWERVCPGRVEPIDGNAPDPQRECARYAALLAERPLDIVCAGIGENGHMAFNDPHVADFHDRAAIKVVTLDATCRQQQVNDGAFATLAQVPTAAMTLTMPALLSAARIFCVVPGATKAQAVARTCLGPISEACPASAMRQHDAAVLYLDSAAAAGLEA